MRKFILIAAMSLLATQAFAGGTRSLSLATTDASRQAAEPPATTAAVAPQVTQAPAATPPANVQTATTTPALAAPAAAPQGATAPTVTPARPTVTPVVSTSEVTRPRRQPSTEARVIRELHRHGIYW
ncbi:hypothetical protein [Bradyrhizobium ganzhouense]|uniref:hypothetical protein n=1 Tax=Bradyrhizobium ganzhouense TaxID=1179767 RepID=UPI003CEA352C